MGPIDSAETLCGPFGGGNQPGTMGVLEGFGGVEEPRRFRGSDIPRGIAAYQPHIEADGDWEPDGLFDWGVGGHDERGLEFFSAQAVYAAGEANKGER